MLKKKLQVFCQVSFRYKLSLLNLKSLRELEFICKYKYIILWWKQSWFIPEWINKNVYTWQTLSCLFSSSKVLFVIICKLQVLSFICESFLLWYMTTDLSIETELFWLVQGYLVVWVFFYQYVNWGSWVATINKKLHVKILAFLCTMAISFLFFIVLWLFQDLILLNTEVLK